MDALEQLEPMDVFVFVGGRARRLRRLRRLA